MFLKLPTLDVLLTILQPSIYRPCGCKQVDTVQMYKLYSYSNRPTGGLIPDVVQIALVSKVILLSSVTFKFCAVLGAQGIRATGFKRAQNNAYCVKF